MNPTKVVNSHTITDSAILSEERSEIHGAAPRAAILLL